jgi:CheY-like chemotaxis protein
MQGWNIAGGRSVAKILVADDNSNIQKMVILALKDQGIDVVAVGNGEAAVRKISDIRPDLVLADVFMPVRNGYEVCQYVKSDSTLSHIPVILLVGAFDPLDEQEAQRVGADGVLKKPFVPPDPLISMVKSALARAGIAHPGSSAAKTPELEPLKASDLVGPRAQTVPTVNSSPLPVAPPPMPILAADSESFVDEVPARPAPVRIDAGSQTVAFGSMLETPAVETEEDLGFPPVVHPDLATERDWRDPDTEEEAEEEEEQPAAPWRHEETEASAGAEPTRAAKDWRTGGFEQIAARKSGVGDWEPAEENPAVVEAAETAHKIGTTAKETLTTATPTETATPAATSGGDAWPAATSGSPQEKIAAEMFTVVEEVAHTASHVEAATEATVTNTPEVKPSEQETKAPSNSWYSIPSNPWGAEVQKANQLATAWDSAVVTSAPSAASNGAEKAAYPFSLPPAAVEAAQSAIEKAALPAAAVEAIREEAAQVAENATHAVEQPTIGEGRADRQEEAAAASTPSMDDLVAKVLANLSPDVLQAVTREILKPVVAAMVKEEMKSKKS